MKTNTRKLAELESQVGLLRTQLQQIQRHLGLPTLEDLVQKAILDLENRLQVAEQEKDK